MLVNAPRVLHTHREPEGLNLFYVIGLPIIIILILIMEESIQTLSSLPERAGMLFCFVGELALQYYNVPRIVHVGQR